MSALAHQQNGYLSATKSTGMPRSIEYQLFSRVTGKLNKASKPGAKFPALAEALHENLRLWTTLAIDVMDEDNALPAQLRAQLFYLFEFTQAHTPKVLKGNSDAHVLIEINTSVMRGLRQTPPTEGGE